MSSRDFQRIQCRSVVFRFQTRLDRVDVGILVVLLVRRLEIRYKSRGKDVVVAVVVVDDDED